jgi:hypothetical protein
LYEVVLAFYQSYLEKGFLVWQNKRGVGENTGIGNVLTIVCAA